MAGASGLSDGGVDDVIADVSLVTAGSTAGSLTDGLVVASGDPPHAASEASKPMARRLTNDFLIIFSKLQHLCAATPGSGMVAHRANGRRGRMDHPFSTWPGPGTNYPTDRGGVRDRRVGSGRSSGPARRGVVVKDMDEQLSKQPDLPSSVVPYLAVVGGAEALSFYATAMGAVEKTRMTNDDGTLGHAEFTIGAATFFLADEWPEMVGVRSPVSLGGNSVSLSLEVDDAPAWVERATDAGARVERPVEPGPAEGFQAGWIIDPFGHRWHLTSRLPAD